MRTPAQSAGSRKRIIAGVAAVPVVVLPLGTGYVGRLAAGLHSLEAIEKLGQCFCMRQAS